MSHSARAESSHRTATKKVAKQEQDVAEREPDRQARTDSENVALDAFASELDE
ncbi:hypothetical protein [Rhodococcus sp. WMMA185]|uniref:hypothetical protein n=1 Tax=Rhodococcus sp. WMMA185 TaxID=679318 RepID=UPI0018DE677C|nr:hypothetical protein [Rhodococcus sp. WMMA185]